MSVLITGDFQAEWSNLDLCQQAWDEILGICIERKLKTIVVDGDHKRQYNPIDTRVALWWQRAIKKAIKENIDIVSVLGNHDRVGQYTDAVNWLPILRRAGATVFDKPGVYEHPDRKFRDGRIFILPFANVSTTRRYAQELLKLEPNSSKDILVFHQDVKGAKYNVGKVLSDSKLRVSDLGSDHYRFVVGGHIHNPQKVEGNVFYVGSPFCEDWGEANQQKRYLVYHERRLESVKTSLPGWYDSSLPNFKAPVDWNGARLRVHVPISNTSRRSEYARILGKAQRVNEHRCPGAIVTVIPRVDEARESKNGRIRIEDSDRVKLKEYIRGAETDGTDGKKALKYMLEKLSHFESGLRIGKSVKFIKAWGRNVLPFRKVELDLRQKGIIVVRGVNLDRNKKSNGSGKTSLLQLLPVPIFGSTFKEQKHDHWANRWESKESAEAGLLVRDYKGRKVCIVRGRRPPSLQLAINGKDQSSGMKSNDRDGTQSQIEQVVGFTWQTFANAVYIDRAVAHAFLSGTKKERTDVLSRFQNLDRFAKALDLVKRDIKEVGELSEDTRRELKYLEGRISESKENLREAKETVSTELDKLHATWRKHRRDGKRWARKHRGITKKLEKREQRAKRLYDDASKDAFKIEKSFSIITNDLEKAQDELESWDRLKKKEMCPLCLQDVESGWIEKRSRSLKAKVNDLEIKRDFTRKLMVDARKNVHMLDAKCTEISVRIGKLVDEGKAHLTKMNFYKNQWLELKSDKHSSETIVGKTRKKLKKYRLKKDHYKVKLKSLRRRLKMYEFAAEAFSRDGIPAFLNSQLCPVLNKAADYYADLFSDNELQLRFVMEKGEFVPQVVNTTGGESIDDQSAGERALAGLIASFALREVAPSTNILVLDEPGEGLDEQTTRQFARALQKLKSRFDSIWVVTHNQVLLSELSGEKIITVRKKNRIAKVIQGEDDAR